MKFLGKWNFLSLRQNLHKSNRHKVSDQACVIKVGRSECWSSRSLSCLQKALLRTLQQFASYLSSHKIRFSTFSDSSCERTLGKVSQLFATTWLGDFKSSGVGQADIQYKDACFHRKQHLTPFSFVFSESNKSHSDWKLNEKRIEEGKFVFNVWDGERRRKLLINNNRIISEKEQQKTAIKIEVCSLVGRSSSSIVCFYVLCPEKSKRSDPKRRQRRRKLFHFRFGSVFWVYIRRNFARCRGRNVITET